MIQVSLLRGLTPKHPSRVRPKPRSKNVDFYFKNDSAELYEYTRNSCLKSGSVDSETMNNVFGSYKLSNDKQSFTVISSNEIFMRRYSKLDNLPVFCEPNNLLSKSTPTKIFTHIWHTFNDYYAFFEEHNVDWSEQYSQYYPFVNDDMSDDELFALLSKMLKPLDDGHISLTSDNDDYSPESNSKYLDELIEAFNYQTKYKELRQYLAIQSQQLLSLPLNYITKLKQLGGENADVVSWGVIGDDIGYIRFLSMGGFYENSTLDDIDGIALDVKALNMILDEVMKDLENTKSMIVDVRLNLGGTDIASMIITNRFASQKKRVLSKYTRTYAGNSPKVHAYIKPTNETVSNPVVVLSSQITASAAEVFLMAMGSQSHVTLMGESSNGALSDVLKKALPNGWDFALSNEVYLDHLGESHEIKGVPMDETVTAISLSDLDNEVDSALIRAIEYLGFKVP